MDLRERLTDSSMPDLLHTLQGSDLGFLRMVALAWGVDLTAPDAYTALPALTNALCAPGLVEEILESLPAESLRALQVLMENEGRLLWSTFARQFGELRVMGAGKRDRERPDLSPANPAERLYYHGLIGKAFLNLPPEPQEFAFIPDDFLPAMQHLAAEITSPLGRPASPTERAHPLAASDAILDQACTLLAWLRLGNPPESLPITLSIPLPVLTDLLHAAGLLDGSNQPQPEEVRAFLEAPAAEALLLLVQAWLTSPGFNELRLLPGLIFEGNWANDALATRRTLLDLLHTLPANRWWSLSAFIAAIKERQPDYLRPGGDYDSWFIRHAGSETYLRGFSTWDEVDGALLRFFITGPLHWLGLYDLATPQPGGPVTAFRPSPMFYRLLNGSLPAGLSVEDSQIRLTSTGRMRLPARLSRPVRYTLLRFCRWDGENDQENLCSITPASLSIARQQGLRTTHLINLLRKHSADPISPVLMKALERWEKLDVQASLQSGTLLRLGSAEILAALRKSSTNRYILEELNPTTVLIRPGSEESVINALLEIGYLTEDKRRE
jgi:hypothetical protein